MTEHKALERLAKRLKGKLYDQDIEAFKVLDEYIKEQDEKAKIENVLFAKLVVYMLRVEAAKGKPASVIFRQIETILQMSMYQSVELMALETPQYKLENIVHIGTDGLDPIKDYEKIKNIRLANMQKNYQACMEALTTEFDTNDAVLFINHQINKLVKTYQNTP